MFFVRLVAKQVKKTFFINDSYAMTTQMVYMGHYILYYVWTGINELQRCVLLNEIPFTCLFNEF